MKNGIFSIAFCVMSTLGVVGISATPLWAQADSGEAVNIEKLRAQAESGNAEAQLYLGICYSMGEGGVQMDDKEALKWLQRSAQQKNYQAQYMLSLYCLEGRTVKQDKELGLKLLKSSAEGGFAEAQYEYASHLAENDQMNEAMPWMRKAADQGFVPAQTALGVYLVNMSKPESEEMRLGLEYLTLAAIDGDADAQVTLGGVLLEQKETVAAIVWMEMASLNGNKEIAGTLEKMDVTPEECYEVANTFFMGDGIIPKNYGKFRYWAEKAAAKNNPTALFLLGTFYVSGYDHQLDPEKGVKYLEMAAEAGLPDAIALLAICYRNGRGVEADVRKSIELLQKAAKLKNPRAFTQLAFSSLFGIGIASKEEVTKKLFERAVSMNQQTARIFMNYCARNQISLENGAALLKQIETAAKEGDPIAQFLMGEFYGDGCGVKMNEKTMLAYYTLAAKQNYAPAMTALSWAYEMGIVVKENRDTAIQLALKAANQGDQEALSYLTTVGQVETEEDTEKAE